MRSTITSMPAALGCMPSAWMRSAPEDDAVEEERIEDGAIFLGELRIDRLKSSAVFRAHIGRRAHAREKHRQVPLSDAGKEPVECRARYLGVGAAERIVGAEFDDNRVGIVPDRPVGASHAVARRVAGDRGIDDLHVVASRLQRRLEPARERGRLVEAVAGDQAVAKGDDPDRPRLRCSRCRGPRSLQRPR